MKKKVIGILLCLLVIVPVLSVTAGAEQGPELEIGEIRGGILYNTVEIKNVGDADASDVKCWVNQSGGLFGLSMNNCLRGFQLASGHSEIVDHPVGFAFGTITITVTAFIPGENLVSKTVNAFVIGIFVIILSE